MTDDALIEVMSKAQWEHDLGCRGGIKRTWENDAHECDKKIYGSTCKAAFAAIKDKLLEQVEVCNGCSGFGKVVVALEAPVGGELSPHERMGECEVCHGKGVTWKEGSNG